MKEEREKTASLQEKIRETASLQEERLNLLKKDNTSFSEAVFQ